MKALAGGLITDARIAWLFMRQYDNVVPIWGVERMSELEEFLSFEADHPVWTDELREKMARDKAELSGNFCRGCGYCIPCPLGIDLAWLARIPFLLRRVKPDRFMTPEWRAKVRMAENCAHCGECGSRCPYELDIPALLSETCKYYKSFEIEWDARGNN